SRPMLELPTTSRVLIEAQLRPIQGTRFQPTGFPDVGAATYRLPDGTEMLLVESAQSMANRLEAVCWDEARDEVVTALDGLPYVRVTQDGKPLTTSLQEAHRLNSAYIEKSDGFDAIKAVIGSPEPFDRRRLASALLRLDPNSLLHGTFLESISGVLRLARAVSGFVEAHNVQVVASGGVKNDRVRPSKDADSGATAAEGFGNVPFHRDEYTAERITAFFNIDLSQIRSYGLGPDAERFLFALALWKIRRVLDEGLRLRTACDLDVIEVRATRPGGFELPTTAVLEDALKAGIAALAAREAFAAPPVTTVAFTGAGKKKAGGKSKKKGDAEEAAE
ncbi:MAG: type I-U CRISPR-associated protein Cas7, partial [Myxococcales bacterium]|nr:type I-U CRISPR-associated protein Cas7 [Myxococcales bacterium]